MMFLRGPDDLDELFLIDTACDDTPKEQPPEKGRGGCGGVVLLVIVLGLLLSYCR